MNVFLTGATGFLGHHIHQELKRRGINVVSLSRQPASEVGYVQGDLLTTSSYLDALTGCDAVIHAAGQVSHLKKDAKSMWQIHVDALNALIDSSRKRGIKRFVLISSSGVIGVSKTPETIATEESDSPLDIIKEWPYYRAKHFGEALALSENKPDFAVLTLNPSLLLGPGAPYGESTKAIRLFLDGKMPISPGGGLSFADVRDVAIAAVNALSMGNGGSRYLLGSANMSFFDFYQKIARIAGKAEPLFKAPKSSHKWIGALPSITRLTERFGIELEAEDIELASHFWYIDDSKANAELNWSPRDPLETLEDTIFEIQSDSPSYEPWL